jgi:hypothetical protein
MMTVPYTNIILLLQSIKWYHHFPMLSSAQINSVLVADEIFNFPPRIKPLGYASLPTMCTRVDYPA